MAHRVYTVAIVLTQHIGWLVLGGASIWDRKIYKLSPILMP